MPAKLLPPGPLPAGPGILGPKQGGAAAPALSPTPAGPGCHLLQQLTVTPPHSGVTFNTARSHQRLTVCARRPQQSRVQPHPTCGVVNPAVVQQVLLASPPNVLLLEGTTPRNRTSFPKKEGQDLPGLRRPGGDWEAFQRGGSQRSGAWTSATYTQGPGLGKRGRREKG